MNSDFLGKYSLGFMEILWEWRHSLWIELHVRDERKEDVQLDYNSRNYRFRKAHFLNVQWAERANSNVKEMQNFQLTLSYLW